MSLPTQTRTTAIAQCASASRDAKVRSRSPGPCLRVWSAGPRRFLHRRASETEEHWPPWPRGDPDHVSELRGARPSATRERCRRRKSDDRPSGHVCKLVQDVAVRLVADAARQRDRANWCHEWQTNSPYRILYDGSGARSHAPRELEHVNHSRCRHCPAKSRNSHP